MQTVNQTHKPSAGPLVSVVMVVCNVERFLDESIESILGQTYGNLEFVIVDFGLSDKSKDIVGRTEVDNHKLQIAIGLTEDTLEIELVQEPLHIADHHDNGYQRSRRWLVSLINGLH